MNQHKIYIGKVISYTKLSIETNIATNFNKINY